MAEKREVKRWITVRGARVPIYEGDSVKDAIKNRFSNKKAGNGSGKGGNCIEKINKNNSELEEKLTAHRLKENKGEYYLKREKWEDDYYSLFRENEAKNAKIKSANEKGHEKYEFVEAYGGYKAKAERLDQQTNHGEWYGKEYTNDEFIEHLEDANWHKERKMLLDAGLTNEQLKYIKDNTKLSMWGASLDIKRTQQLIDTAKSRYPEKKSLTQIAGYETRAKRRKKATDNMIARSKDIVKKQEMVARKYGNDALELNQGNFNAMQEDNMKKWKNEMYPKYKKNSKIKNLIKKRK